MSILNSISGVFDTTLSTELQDNIIEYYDWGLLEKGNYFNVHKGETSYNGEDYSLLQISSNPHYVSGKAWEGFRKNWVWQSGITYSPPPFVSSSSSNPGISGIYIDDQFYPSDTVGQYSYNIDYFNGRVVFNSPIPTGSKVQVEYSYKYINVLYANNLPWVREVQKRTLELPVYFDNSEKREYNIPAESRIQLPAIAIEIVPQRKFKPFEMGSLSQYIYTDVLFHCIAEDSVTRDKMVDIVSRQHEFSFQMFDSNKIAKNNDFPLNYLGYPVSGAKTFPSLVSNYGGHITKFTNTTIQAMQSINQNLFVGIVRTSCETII